MATPGVIGNTYVEQEFRVLQTDRSLNGVFTYPFTKAQRLEVTGGGRQIGFKQDVTIRTYSLQTGQQLDESREVIQEFENLNLGEASAALVRHLDLRCGQSDPGNALSPRGLAEHRFGITPPCSPTAAST